MTWAPMSPPVGVLLRSTRSGWIDCMTAHVEPPTMITAVNTRMIRAVVHG